MKKSAIIFLSVLMILSLTACGKGNQEKAENTLAGNRQEAPESKDNGMKDTEENKESGTEISGFSGTIQTISKLQPDADVISDGLSISRNSVASAESEVVDWVNGVMRDVSDGKENDMQKNH